MRYEACPEIIKYLPSCQYRTRPVFSAFIAQAALGFNRVRTGKRRRHAVAGYVLSAPLRSTLADRPVRAPEAPVTLRGWQSFRADRTRPRRPNALLEPRAAVMARRTVRSRPFIGQIRHVVQAVAHFLATACPSEPTTENQNVPFCPFVPLWKTIPATSLRSEARSQSCKNLPFSSIYAPVPFISVCATSPSHTR